MSYEPYYSDGWQSGENGGTPITPEALNHIEDGIMSLDSNKAPAGYGLGGDAPDVADLSALTACGWYEYGANATDNPVPGYTGIVHVNKAGTITVQRAYPAGFQGHPELIRKMVPAVGDAAYREWEWVNPPMALDVEYRTTERWQGKPVYTKMINCGTIPASGRTVIAHNLGFRIIRIVGSTDNGSTMPYRDPYNDSTMIGNGYVDIGSSSNNLIISSNLSSGNPPGTGMVQLWYVKD